MASSVLDTLVSPLPSLHGRAGFARLLLLLLGAYALTIIYGFHQLSRAIETRDVALLRETVDWTAVRDQLKADLVAGAPQDSAPRPLFDLGRAIAGGVTSIMVDALATPERVGAYLDEEQIHHLRVTDIAHVRVLGPNEYSFAFRQFRVFVRRADLFTWKVVRVDPLNANGESADGPQLYERLLSPAPRAPSTDGNNNTPANDRNGLGRLIENANGK